MRGIAEQHRRAVRPALGVHAGDVVDQQVVVRRHRTQQGVGGGQLLGPERPQRGQVASGEGRRHRWRVRRRVEVRRPVAERRTAEEAEPGPVLAVQPVVGPGDDRPDVRRAGARDDGAEVAGRPDDGADTVGPDDQVAGQARAGPARCT